MNRHPAELCSPVTERGVTEVMLPAQRLDRHAGFRLLQKNDDPPF
jgi:hypothetical protein